MWLVVRVKIIAMKGCYGLGGFQTFILSKYDKIKSSSDCMTTNHLNSELVITSCDFSEAQKWLFKPILDNFGQIIHQKSEKWASFDKQTITIKLKSSSIMYFLSFKRCKRSCSRDGFANAGRMWWALAESVMVT